MGLEWSASYAVVTHGVDPDQYERDPVTGRLLPVQAYRHRVEMFLTDFTISARLGVVRWFGISTQLPVRIVHTTASFKGGPLIIRKHAEHLPNFESIHHRDETLAGVGDLQLRLHFPVVRPHDHKGWMLEIAAGVAFPTGRTEQNPYALGRAGLSHQHVFFGSGTFDPVASLTVGKRFRRWALLGWSEVRGAVYENRRDYQAGVTVTGGLGASSAFGLKKWRFRLQAEVYHQEPALWEGEREEEDGGRTDLLIGLSTRWQLHKKWALRLLLKVPVTLRSVGAKVTLPVIATLGVDASFKLF